MAKGIFNNAANAVVLTALLGAGCVSPPKSPEQITSMDDVTQESQIRKIEWQGDGDKQKYDRRIVSIKLSEEARLFLETNPTLEGEELYDALIEHGAVLHDSGAEGAFQSFMNGKLYADDHYRDGELHDPKDGEPAVSRIDPVTGEPVYRGFYQYGEMQDPPSGEPAYQFYDEGRLIEAGRFQGGEFKNVLTPDELKAFEGQQKDEQSSELQATVPGL